MGLQLSLLVHSADTGAAAAGLSPTSPPSAGPARKGLLGPQRPGPRAGDTAGVIQSAVLLTPAETQAAIGNFSTCLRGAGKCGE